MRKLLGAIKDTPDARDFIYGTLLKTTPLLPPVYDLENKCTPVKDQAQRGSCVAFANVGMKEQHYKVTRKRTLNLSEEFIYDQIMQQGGGAMPRDAVSLFIKLGCCSEKVLPYKPTEQDVTPIHLHPTATELTSAKRYKSSAYARLQTVSDMKLSLFQNGAFSLAVNWLEQWFDPIEQILGYPIVRLNQGSIAGGHDICVVGYNDQISAFKIKQSWGKSWGKNGFFYMDYKAVEQNLSDCWTTFDPSASHINTQKVSKLLGGEQKL